MKNIFKLLGVIVLVAVIGFSMAACGGDDGGGDGGGGSGLTITGIPSQYNGKYALYFGTHVSGGSGEYLLGCQSYDDTTKKPTLVKISNGSVSLPMWIFNNNNDTIKGKFSGNTKSYGSFDIYDSPTIAQINASGRIAYAAWMSIGFSNGKATQTWDSASSKGTGD